MSEISSRLARLSPEKQALLARQLRVAGSEPLVAEPLAIVGIGCRFPGGANTLEAFWQLLVDGVDTISEVPEDRWDVNEFYDPDPAAPGKLSTRFGSFLSQVDQFDPYFFGISPREAAGMDPQQRVLLEVAWEALENAGLPVERLAGSKTGVFIGTHCNDFAWLRFADATSVDAYASTGTAHSIVANRISYLFDLRGPSLAVDTACSSSLVAVHLACLSLRHRECDVALAGGINLILSPLWTIAVSKMGMMAADGRCKTFDARADGFVRGEGCGLVVLKRLSDALSGRDHIWAIIRGSATNQDGCTNGLTAPNGLSQQSVVRQALENAGVGPARITYIEAHGTGTALGDPIEVEALAEVLGQPRPDAQACGLGSVKTNIGHLEAAAGIAGLIKAVLCLRHEAIPPNLHFKTLNPHISLTNTRFFIPTELHPWPSGAERRYAGVSSFGFGGTNAHVILEEAPLDGPEPAFVDRPRHLLALSAKTKPALRALAARYAAHLAGQPGQSIADVCYTANVGRSHFAERAALVVDSTVIAQGPLEALAKGAEAPGLLWGQRRAGASPKVAFLFTGQGAQYVGMGKELYETAPVFRGTLDRCDALLRPHLNRSLRSVLYPESGNGSGVDETAYTQPALFALEYALAELWRSWGIEPAAVLGHSVGEYVAACAAGAISLEDACALVAARGRLMQALPRGGAMAAVFADEESVRAAMSPFVEQVAVAALNGPQHTVISGDEESVERLRAAFAARGVTSRRLVVSHAFHSPLIEPILEAFEVAARGVSSSRPDIPLVSNLTGDFLDRTPDAAYWRRHARETVRFFPSVRRLQQRGVDAYLEIGPHPVLIGMGRHCLPTDVGLWLPSLRRGRDDWQQMLESLGALYVAGVAVDWGEFDRPYPRRRVSLPTYPFERERYAVTLSRHPRSAPVGASDEPVLHPLLGRRVHTPLAQVLFEAELGTGVLPFLRDHRVGGRAVVPAAAYLEMGLALGASALAVPFPCLAHVIITQPMTMEEGAVRRVQSILTSEGPEHATFQIFSRSEGEEVWQLHAEGRITAGRAGATSIDLAALQARCGEPVAVEGHYDGLRCRGLDFGPAFCGVEAMRCGRDEVLARVYLPEGLQAADYRFHPALLDACFQAAGGLLPKVRAEDMYLPMGVEAFHLCTAPSERLWSHARARASNGRETLILDLTILNDAGRVVAEVNGLRLQRLTSGALRGTEEAGDDRFYEIVFRPKPLPSRRPSDLPSPGAIAAEVAPLLSVLGERSALGAYGALSPEIESLSADYVRLAFSQLGWTGCPGERVTAEALAVHLGVIPGHRRLLGRFLAILGEVGILRRDGTEWEVVRTVFPPGGDVLRRRVADLATAHPECHAQLALLDRCGANLAAALRGERDPLELLFPEGSLALVEAGNQDTPFSRFFNGVIEEAVIHLVAGFPSGRTLRVLEVGAGTGSATSCVLRHFPADRTEYVFTDLSTLFTMRAREKFKPFSFVQYGILNIEDDPVAQGFAPGSFDLVIAANVLHATRDLAETARHVHRLLAPDGTLILREGTVAQRWVDVTFGLTEGWWRFTDCWRRPSYPLLDAAGWRALLTEMGLSDIAFLPAPEAAETQACQEAVILARRQRSEASGSVVTAAGRYLIFADTSGLGRTLADRLAASGDRVTLVQPSTGIARIGEETWTLDPMQPDEFRRLLRDAAGGLAWKGVVHLWSLDTAVDPKTVIALETDVARACGSVLHIVQALAADPGATNLQGLWLVTRGAQAADAASPVRVGQSPLTGLAKVIALEHPELHAVHVDLDPSGGVDEVDALAQEIFSGDGEDGIALRGGERLVARVLRWRSRANVSPSPVPPTPVRLEMQTRGVLDNLVLRSTLRRSPGPGEVEIKVRAAGLNFRDVLCALDMYPGEPGPLGVECAGEVVALGVGVEGFRVGEEVVAIAPGSFATFVVTDARLVVPRPPGMSPEEAATIPSTFVTAWYSLHHVGRISAGERVLIHAAAGGVGLSALQVARRAGAEVFATAGSPEKREFLRSLGVRHVMDSRSLEFVREVVDSTGGRGVDIVLNSLTGEFIPKGLSVLAPGGRFIELGQREVWDGERVASARADVEYASLNLLELSRRDPELVGSLLRQVFAAVQEGSIAPLPRRAFPLADAVEAFRYMAQARHIGKIVLTQRDATAPGTETIRLRGDATYLITGGLGGLGLQVARWMADRGARSLVLVGRSEPDAAACEAVMGLQKDGVAVDVVRADVASHEEVLRVLDGIRRGRPPLRGVIHAAGTLDDGILLQQDWSRFAKIMAAKVSGSWLLHRLTESAALDFFVLFSAGASFLGRPGQSNHAAANAFEDALAHARRRSGLPAISINWGAWGEVGAVTRGGVEARITASGFRTLTPDEGLGALELVLAMQPSQVAVLSVDWSRFFASIETGREPRLLQEIAREVRKGKGRVAAPAAREPSLLERLAQSPPGKRRGLLVGLVYSHAVRVLGLEPSRPIDPQQPLHELGLDSLMAVELRNALGTAIGRPLPATLLFDYPTLDALAGHLGQVLAPDCAEVVSSHRPDGEAMPAVKEIEQLSETEAEVLLLKELEAAKKTRRKD